MSQASVTLRIDDYGLQSETRRFGTPHDVLVRLFDVSGKELAQAHSVEPMGYILAAHPDPLVGNCEHRGVRAPNGPAAPGDYESCFKQFARWSANWAPRVHRADISVGSCVVRDVPIHVNWFNDDWWLWWVPLPHVGGLPRQYFEFSMAIDSRTCVAVAESL